MASSTVAARASTSVAAFQKVEVGNVATKASRAFAVVPAVCKRGQSLTVRASAEEAAVPRRAMLSLLAAAAATAGTVQRANAEASSIQIGPPPKPFGGLPGTKNADEARDLEQPLKQRFFLQSEDVAGAQARLKASAAAIQDSEKFIAKKAWPYVQNQLRLEAQYLNFDIDTIASSKPQQEKKAIKALQKSLNAELDSLDFAARKKSVEKAKASYDKVVSLLNDVIAKA